MDDSSLYLTNFMSLVSFYTHATPPPPSKKKKKKKLQETPGFLMF